ncbi:MAG: hypothetical protein IJ740_06655 [Ruminococcus sp.]|nr:hypothetical protein [Ruminococcus sp.]
MFYIYVRILASLGVFAFPIVILQFGVLIRIIMLIKKYRHLKVENKADIKDTAVIICYSILTAILWIPLIIFSLWIDIKGGYNQYFSIIRNWYINGEYIIQGIMLVILTAIIAFRNNKHHSIISKISFCVYALCEFIITFFYIGLSLESVLITIGGVFLSVSIGSIIGTSIYKKMNSDLS